MKLIFKLHALCGILDAHWLPEWRVLMALQDTNLHVLITFFISDCFLNH